MNWVEGEGGDEDENPEEGKTEWNSICSYLSILTTY